MSVLSDGDIAKGMAYGLFNINPFSLNRIQPASYDVALSNEFRVFKPRNLCPEDMRLLAKRTLDPRNLGEFEYMESIIVDEGAFRLRPSEFVLGMTEEYVRLGADVAARLEGKSSLGRIGIVIHSTAGWIDPGFEGRITLEIHNVSPFTTLLHPGMLIGQLAFMPMSSTVERPYGSPGLGSKYQGHMKPTQSRYDG